MLLLVALLKLLAIVEVRPATVPSTQVSKNIMSRSRNQSLLRAKPEMAHAVQVSKGQEDAAMAVEDAIQEEIQYGNLLVNTFEVGKKYWFEMAIWVYLGKCVFVGYDYVLIENACRVPVDGRHSQMMSQGCEGVNGIEVETTGQPPRNLMRLSIDAIFASCEWNFNIPTTSIPNA